MTESRDWSIRRVLDEYTAKVLLAENHTETRELFDLAFRRLGLLPITAEDGMAAMTEYWSALYSAYPFRLIWLDLAMPRMDGLTVAKRIREVESRVDARASLASEYGYPPPTDVQRAYIIGCTAHADLEKDEEQFSSFDSIIYKPIDLDEIRDALRVATPLTGITV
jgi:CheY-like chemotaxis protein